MNKDITLEDLDFHLSLESDTRLMYERFIECRNDFYSEVLTFKLDDKELDIDNFCDICLDLLKAIYNKCKEIGWFDE